MAKRTCSVDGCERLTKATMCPMHYRRWSLTGDPGEAASRRTPRQGLICSIDQCDRPVYGRGICILHYNRLMKTGTTALRPKPLRRHELICSVDQCDQPPAGRGLCNKHYYRFKRHGTTDLQPRPRRPRNVTISNTGYRLVWENNKPRLEHRIIMEEILGRPLLRSENVHHVNGQKTDNRPNNLELWSTAQPSGQRVVDKIAWAIELLALYQPDALANRHVQLTAGL